MISKIVDPFEMQSIVTRFIENGSIKVALSLKKNTIIQQSLRDRRHALGLTSKGKPYKRRAPNMGQSKDRAAYMRAWREMRRKKGLL